MADRTPLRQQVDTLHQLNGEYHQENRSLKEELNIQKLRNSSLQTSLDALQTQNHVLIGFITGLRAGMIDSAGRGRVEFDAFINSITKGESLKSLDVVRIKNQVLQEVLKSV